MREDDGMSGSDATNIDTSGKTRTRVEILGVRFDAVGARDALSIALGLAESGRADYAVTPNAEIVYACRKDGELRDIVNRASLAVADGIGVVYASGILGTKPRIREKVAGIELGEALLAGLAEKGLSLYLLGGKPGVAALAAKRLCEKHPGLRVAGTADGYFTDPQQAAAAVRESGADVVYVCLGAPKQEHFMARWGEASGARLLIGLGGSVDHYAGLAERAPDLWIRLGLEWLYRLIKNPSRLGRAMNLPKFLFAVLGERLFGKKTPSRGA